MEQLGTFSDVRLKIIDVEDKKRQFERQRYVFLRELSPEEAIKNPKFADLKMDETVLRFKHPDQ
jgi:hypothetical protein